MTALSIVAGLTASVRWLRVGQREHYLPWSVTRFATRWWRQPENLAMAAVGVGMGLVSPWGDLGTVLALLALTAAPLRLSWRGRTSALVLTRRLVRLAAVAVVLIVGAGLALGAWAWVLPALVPLLLDLSLLALAPIEERMSRVWVTRAAETLERTGVRTVAITGSYGKTSTKQILGHLLAGMVPTVASPASFNNRIGLARAVNEHLSPGTEVFVAEMGTYGPGEIRAMCSWVKPEVAVITALGPVHLERMKSLEGIAAAKREIFENAKVAVVMVDHPLLERIAEEEEARRRVVTVSIANPQADVYVNPADGGVYVSGKLAGTPAPNQLHPGNLACALGAIVGLGFDPGQVLDRVGDTPLVAHRQEATVSERGVHIIDNTFNSNPAGARSAVASLAASGTRRRVLVTPGMVELGRTQRGENQALAREAAAWVTDLVVVGRTNRRALVAGAAEGGLASVIVVSDRAAAVEWVRRNLGDGDAVLYENDLPDHFV